MAHLFHHLFCFLLLQLPLFISAQTYSNITLGSSKSNLDENPYWTSPSGDFAFGFHPHQDLFLLATWYAKIPVKTIVWTANQGKPVERGAKIELTTNGVLSLTTSNGTGIWKAEATANSQVAYAAMLNTGNFVLSTAESKVVWATFEHPTDTILPNQILDITKQADNKFSSPVSDDDYTIGKFELELQSDGNLVFYSIARPTETRNEAYWQSNTVNNGSQLVFNQSGDIYLTLRSGGVRSLSQRPASTEDYQRATLDYDGVFRQYTYPKTSPRNGWPESWSTSWSLPEICRDLGPFGNGVCGYNSICRRGNNEIRGLNVCAHLDIAT
ncbi:G-type lectin S-receptor-like serine/threonine-protein kinase LECRK1 [Thalictrum thalictroides]|uniref:G-type lectin S-receptor-like serine/threonine-protein kinase LECRK1 n=1 Tax=Thalictrum thalictroides TaxID=46969 RepID=A0A7J6VEQ4_THATH|nr:G-type lectin S-receptor-like serine/threonine-protein kinase LECRK1 [Thalictrum thalictroides]